MALDAKECIRRSRFLSLVLRHRPETIGLKLDAAGWTSVEQLLTRCAAAGQAMTLEDLCQVVETNTKRRFEFSEDGLRIRARQGHSIQVELGYEPARPPDTLYHGTAERNRSSILARGLLKGRRHHVHLSVDVATARMVGSRYGEPVVLRIDAGRMYLDGCVFYRTGNNVWLTEHVPVMYLRFPKRAG